MRNTQAEPAPLLEVRDLSKTFFALPALRRVNLRVDRGDLLGVIGPNGSGKTTLFNCVTGILRPSGGDVWFEGETITGIAPDGVYRRGISRTFQLIQLFPEMTALENLLMAVQERAGTLLARLLRREEREETDRARGLLEYLGLSGAADQAAANLSYGQQKLLDFAMALMSNPRLVLLDEPMAGVNPTMIKALVARIRELNARGYTFVVIEHNMEVVMSLCRRIVVLSQGAVIAEGTPEGVRDNRAVMDAYFGS
jgi:branched-chain amino acid transport system ATP-binding protein